MCTAERFIGDFAKDAEDSRIPIRRMLGGFSAPEHQNIRKAVLCVLPKEFCVRRSGKDPMIQGVYYFDE